MLFVIITVCEEVFPEPDIAPLLFVEMLGENVYFKRQAL
jgi:hypothetical protein